MLCIDLNCFDSGGEGGNDMTWHDMTSLVAGMVVGGYNIGEDIAHEK